MDVQKSQAWYQDHLGKVFIVPDEEFAAAEIEGPDSETIDRLKRICLRCESEGVAFKKIAQAGIAKALELLPVDTSNRRFDLLTGRYFAEGAGV